MKKYILSILIFSTLLISNPLINDKASASELSIKDFVNLLITIGVITPDKITSVNAFLLTLETQSTSTDPIYDIKIKTESNSARVDWKTSTSTESKVFIEGKTYFSKRGIGTVHYVDIGGLESELEYSGTVSAISNNSWTNKDFNFTTERKPAVFDPDVKLNKYKIKNDGKDTIEVTVETIDSYGDTVPNKDVEIITAFGLKGSLPNGITKKLNSGHNGVVFYKTPTTKIEYNRCGQIVLLITIKIDGELIFSKEIPIENAQDIPEYNSGGGRFPNNACA